MWNKPWTLKEGFVIGAGLIVAGMMLELSVGPVVWETFAWPVNVIVLGVFVALIVLMHLMRHKAYALRFLSTYQAAVPVMCYAVVLTVIMGLTRQAVNGVGLNNMLTFWPFVLTYVYMAVIVGLVVLKELSTVTKQFSVLRATVLAFHLGLFITMTTATLGNADMQRMKMITAVGELEWRVINQQGEVEEMPLAIELKKFIMETYDDGSPKRFASEIEIMTQTGKHLQATVDVNNPAKVEGWKIYQYGYDETMGANSTISILELVSDPWLPFVYTGIYMMLAGGLLMFVFGTKNRKS